MTRGKYCGAAGAATQITAGDCGVTRTRNRPAMHPLSTSPFRLSTFSDPIYNNLLYSGWSHICAGGLLFLQCTQLESAQIAPPTPQD
eukprot:gene18561-biopygen18973